MRDLPLVSRRATLRFAWLAATALTLTGCADSSRFGEPLGNPFQTFDQVDRAPTGSVPVQRQAMSERPVAQPVQASNERIVGQPLEPPAPRMAAAAPSAPAIDPAPTASTRGPAVVSSNWTSHGGTPVVMAQGETPAVLADRYGVPVDALVRTNGFSSPSQISPGARLTIPVYSVGAGRAAPPPVRQATVEAPKAAPPPVHTVPRETMPRETMRLVKGPQPAPSPAQAAHRDDDQAAGKKPLTAAKAKLLERTKAAQVKPAEDAPIKVAKPAAPPVRQAIARAEERKPEKPVAAKPVPAEKPVAARPVPIEKPVARAPAIEKPVVAEKRPAIDTGTTASLPAAEAAKPDSSGPEFRWPARGRVIQGFKQGGNDGINIALPEGTAIKAAEEGTVAYAGSELKGYGNLVLIRHPNGFVSAYANNGSLDVKRGDTVKRGQTIAKSGQTGNVSSPQLHFELRKGAQPVDPSGFLANM